MIGIPGASVSCRQFVRVSQRTERRLSAPTIAIWLYKSAIWRVTQKSKLYLPYFQKFTKFHPSPPPPGLLNFGHECKPVPRPTPEDLATENLATAVESAIGVIQERLANLADYNHDAKWSVSDGDAKASRSTGAGLLQLLCTIRAYWVEDPHLF